LRTKLGLLPENGWRLSAIYQHGYRLEQLPRDGADDSPPAVKPKTLGKAKS
jgi:hypothetical protein